MRDVSEYPTWTFRIPLRDDLEPATLRVLEAVAHDTAPDAEDLETLHPVVSHYLADWRRMLTAELPPYVGPPVRLSGLGTTEATLTIEFSQHDDEHANGGYVMWVWALRLAERPARGRCLIGHRGPTLRQNDDWEAIVVDADGTRVSGVPLTWAEVDEIWESLVADPVWQAWTG